MVSVHTLVSGPCKLACSNSGQVTFRHLHQIQHTDQHTCTQQLTPNCKTCNSTSGGTPQTLPPLPPPPHLKQPEVRQVWICRGMQYLPLSSACCLVWFLRCALGKKLQHYMPAASLLPCRSAWTGPVCCVRRTTHECVHALCTIVPCWHNGLSDLLPQACMQLRTCVHAWGSSMQSCC